MRTENPTVAVVGAGAMGSLFGGLLAEGGLAVTLVDVWRDHIEAIQTNGLRMVGFGGDRSISLSATTDPATVGPADVVFVQCKASHTAEAVHRARSLFGPQTVAISFQNGLGNEETIADVIGKPRVLGGLTLQGASIEGPGIVRNYANVQSFIGEMAGGLSDRTRNLSRCFSEHGLPVTASENIRLEIWRKLMINVAVSPTSAIADLPIAQVVAVPEMRAAIDLALSEAAAVATAEGVDIDLADSQALVGALAGKTGANKSSVCVDLLNRRRSEIDVINGAIVRLGREHSIETPVNSAWVGAIKALESKFDNSEPVE